MVRRPVDSSMAKSIGYDAESSTLEIEFQSGEIWQYYEVPESIFYEMKSVSIGKYFQLMIKNQYKEKRVK